MAYGFAETDDVEKVMTFWGLLSRSDDNVDNVYDAALCPWALETAEARLLVYIGHDYEPADLVGNVWIRWATALIAAIFFTRRNGDNTPAGLQREYDELMETLEKIQAGTLRLPGILQPGDYGGISYSAYVIDWRPTLPITRPVLPLSTGFPSSTLPRHSLWVFTNDTSYYI